jgi:hypothetical protein
MTVLQILEMSEILKKTCMREPAKYMIYQKQRYVVETTRSERSVLFLLYL